MSLLGGLFRPQNAMTSAELQLALVGAAYGTDSGAVVSPETAMRLAAVYACVRVIAEGVAQLPLLTYRRTDRGRERAPEHWLYPLLHDEPNAWQTSFEFREMMQAHLCLAGNAYALKTVVRDQVRELLPVAPHRVRVEQTAAWRVLYYVTMPDGTEVLVPPERMFHVPGLSFNGVTGISPVNYQREAIGLGLQMVKHGAKLFTNGAAIAGVLEHPSRLSKEASERLRASFDEKYTGVDNAQRTILLEEGTKFAKTGMSAEDAQFLESRKYSRTEIASIFRVPPHLIGDLERATFTNIEQQALEFVTYTLQPWLVRWEGRITKSLIPPADRSAVYSAFLVQGLLRGDYATRMNGYRTAIGAGWMTRNEVRALEDMNQADGLDEFLTPLYMTAGSADPSAAAQGGKTP